MSSAPDERTLGQLTAAIGSGLLHLVRAPLGTDVPVSGTTIYDPLRQASSLEGSLVLGVGVHPASADTTTLMERLGREGCCGAVIKRYGVPIDALATSADDAGVALLVIDDELAWERVSTLIHTTLAVPARGGSGPSGPAVSDLFELANAIAASVGGAVAIEDVNRRVLGYSTLAEQPIDEERRQGILDRAVPAGPENDDHYRELYSSTRVCRFTTGSPTPRLAMPVRAGSELLGSLWVIDAHGSFGPEAYQALADAADMASLYLLRARASDDLSRHQRGEILHRLLDSPVDDALVARQLGLAVDTSVLVAAFATVPDDTDGLVTADATQHLVDLVSLHCEARYGRHGCVLIDGTVYALLPGDGRTRTQAHQRAVEEVARHASNTLGTPVLAGIGSLVPALRLAATSRRDADMVLRVLSAGTTSTSAGSIEQMHAAVALLELSDLVAREPLSSRAFRRDVFEHDRTRGTEYAVTLLSYFECGGNIAMMSERLNVHPNPCRYRLSRAQKLFALDFDDPDTRLLLWLQLRLAAR